MRKLGPGAPTVLVLALALSACGGSADSTAPSPSSSAATPSASATAGPGEAATSARLGGTFTRATPLPPTVSCTYTLEGSAAKPNTPPPSAGVSAQGSVPATMVTSVGDIGLNLDRAVSPCSVNNFVSLAKQSYFNGTRCHRLVNDSIHILQCGDPNATGGKGGTGGPGYVFDNEYPTDQYPADDPRLNKQVNYPRGTVAMANTGQPNSNGSQFVLIFADSPLPPQFTVFGTIDEAGISVLEKVAAGGNASAGDAKDSEVPDIAVNITNVTIG